MNITLAKSAGFCFGVDKAVQTIYRLLGDNKKVCTLGPIIHNPQLVEEFSRRGVIIIDNIKDVPKGYTLVIRSHGIGKQEFDEIESSNIEYIDTTCPFVKKIHKLAETNSNPNRVILIAGDKDHPEVKGILCYASCERYTFKNEDELENILKIHSHFAEKEVVLLAQTTFNIKLWEKCVKYLKKVCTNAVIFDTICSATIKRQNEAIELAKNNDIMVVIGGKESSNTTKLKEVCEPYAKTYLVETAEAIPLGELKKGINFGITAGASTPASIIKEVLVTMSNTTTNENYENFEELLEESLKSFNTDEKVKGVVVGISPNEVYVDVGRKQAGFIPVSELSADPNVKAEDVVKIGDELMLLIMKTNDQEGTIMLSKKRIDAQKGWDDLQTALDEDAVLTGKVTEIIKGGLIISFKGIRVFVPASQATLSRGDNLEDLKGTEQQFKVIEVTRQRRRALGSIRSILREARKEAQAKLWETLEVDQEYTGKVKSLTAFGAFVDIGGIDGMVHISELSWSRIKHPSEVVSEGMELPVYIKALDKEKGRISLGHKKAEDNPWEIFKTSYEVGTVCDATIVSMTTFGAFARILPSIDGLIHISQIADKRIEKPSDVLKAGEVVKVKITEIDLDKKRISLSIRALLEDSAEEVEEIEE